MTSTRTFIRVFWFFWLALALSRCNTEVRDPAVEATARALATAMPATATQRATSLPNPFAQLQTAQAQATQVAQQAQATLTAQQTLQALQADVTAQAFAPVVAELPYFGVDPATEGHPGWIHPPLTLKAEGYHTYTYGNDYPQTVVRDGVLSAKITWDTKYGSGGCGFVLRANGDEQAPSQYVVLMTRSGQLFFTVFKDGELANLRVIFIRAKDNQFDWHNGATNQLTVVLRNDQISLYTNHVLHKTLDPNELPSLYIPPLRPPSILLSSSVSLQVPLLPSPPALPDNLAVAAQMVPYVNAVTKYADKVNDILDGYVAYLGERIEEEQDATLRAALADYRAQIVLQSRLFRESVGALQYYARHRDDLNLGPGFLSFVAAAESAYATCAFDEAWLWVLDP